MGEKGEYLIKLRDGVVTDPDGEHIAFDYVTTQ